MTAPVKPIAREVLEMLVGATRELEDVPGYGTVSMSDLGEIGHDLAAYALALQDAAKAVLEESRHGIMDEDGVICDGWMAATERLRSLLPKDPPK